MPHSLWILFVSVRNQEAFLKEHGLQYLRLLEALPELELVFVDDGSEDGSIAELEALKQKRIQVFSFPWQGKIESLNQAVSQKSKEAVYFFADGNTEFEARDLHRLAENMSENVFVSGACLAYTQDKAEAAYFDQESRLRIVESQVYSAVGVSGALFCMRGTDFEGFTPIYPLDLEVSLRGLVQGKVSRITPEACVFEGGIYSKERRTRTILRGIACVIHYWPLLLKQGRILALMLLFVHKILRWVSPVMLLLWLVLFVNEPDTSIVLLVLAFFGSGLSLKMMLGSFQSSVKALWLFLRGHSINRW